ncbi:MAG: hypothetical protein IT271_12480 [Chitinophagales bacterium]|nr:hypothetical protein [Chitinophagales bacterium]
MESKVKKVLFKFKSDKAWTLYLYERPNGSCFLSQKQGTNELTQESEKLTKEQFEAHVRTLL